MKINLYVGTRPEAIKLIPLYIKLKQIAAFDVSIISTGQHKEMLYQIFSFFSIQPDEDLSVMTQGQSLSSLSASLMIAISKTLQVRKPNLVIVQGDTTTALIASMASFYDKIKVAHVEAGLRTFDKYSPFPEEINRQLISKIADYHFAPSPLSFQQLKNEGVTSCFETGNTVIDALQIGQSIVNKTITSYEAKYNTLLPKDKRHILITGHRRESFGLGFENICEAILKLSKKYPDLNFIYPVHLNPAVREIVLDLLGNHPSIHLIDPVGYGDMIYLMGKSYLILTDSGGIQEEAPSLGKPLVVLRETTERPEGVTAGCAILAGTNQEAIVLTTSKILDSKALYDQMSSTQNPYGDGKACDRIVEILLKSL